MQLTVLDVSKNAMLRILYCNDNKLESLDVSANKSLNCLNCDNNRLTVLDISKNKSLSELRCNNNNLTSLNAENMSYDRSDPNGTPDVLTLRNYYRIATTTEGTFDLSKLPGEFDVSKVLIRGGGSVDGNILTADKGAEEVVYIYRCAPNAWIQVTLILAKSGDVNLDGSIDAKDMLYMRRYVADVPVGIELDMTAADMDGDGMLTPADCLLLRKTLAGVIDVKAIDKRV